MESLLNFVWLLLGLSLIAGWSIRVWQARESASGHRRPGSRGRSGPLPAIPLQLIAVLLLVVLLFPVISLTDDLAMCTAPRDAERALRLADPLDHAQPAALAASITAWVDVLATSLHEGPRLPIGQQAILTGLLEGIHQTVDSRPPPSA